MNFKEEIYRSFDQKDKVLVFTSETVARAWIQAYALDNPGKAIFKNRAISWDHFASLLTESGDGKPVTDTERRIFLSAWFQQGNYARLKHFAKPEYVESQHAFTRYIAKVLPYFQIQEGDESLYLSPEIYSDIQILKPAYEAFLEEHGLYEPKYLKKDLSRIPEGKYVFVFPETFSDTYVGRVVSSGLVECISGKPENATTKMKVYKNAISEIRGVFRKIARLKETIPLSEMALTCSSLQSYRPYLETEALKRNIPLVFTSRRNLVEYPEGRFFQALYEVYRDTFSIASMKKLFLDPAFPFKDRELFRTIIRIGIDLKIQDGIRTRWLKEFNYVLGNSYLTKKYARVEEAKDLFFEISHLIISIVESEDAMKTERLIKEFRDTYFEENAWNAIEDRIFGTCLEILEEMHVHGTDNFKNAYLLFLQILEDKTYVEKAETKEGLKVYAYPASCGLCTKAHFIMGLDDKSTRKTLDNYPYLTDGQKPEALDIGESILKIYRDPSFAEITEITGTTEGLDGARLLPTPFLDANITVDEIERDSYQEELELLSTGTVSDNGFHPNSRQCASFHSYFQKRSHNPMDLDFGENPNAGPYKLSVSHMKNFDSCPYKGYVSALEKIRRKDYEPEMEDAFEVGNILHETIQKTLQLYGSLKNINATILQSTLIEVAEKYKERHKIPDEATKNHIVGRYSKNLDSILTCTKAPLFNDGTLVGNEIEVTEFHLTPEILLEGRIDTVLKEEDDCCIVLDYKTSGKSDYDKDDINGVSLQIILYAKMLESEESRKGNGFLQEKPRMVKSAGFYSFSDKNFRIVWPEYLYDAGNRKISEGYPKTMVQENADQRIETISNYLRQWSFGPDPSEDHCESCDYARLCRERFAIR